MKSTVAIILLATWALSCQPKPEPPITFPHSQWVIGSGSDHVSWSFGTPEFAYNNSFIAAPDSQNWDQWYTSILDYRQRVRQAIGREEPVLQCEFPSKNPLPLHFDKIAYDLQLRPGEQVEVRAEISGGLPVWLYAGYDLKTRGEELSYVVRQKREREDSLLLQPGTAWQEVSLSFRVPDFSADSFAIAPMLRLQAADLAASGTLQIRNLRLSTPSTPERARLLKRLEEYLAQQAKQNTFEVPEALSWTHQNFVMGFVFIWDQDFWDPAKGEYRVDHFCQKMQREFGGFQSVVLWHSYPNIGIDNRNQFDFFEYMPGGLDGLKQVVADFHRNGVKVFITYNPWDLDTRRPAQHDNKELARIIGHCDVDGIFLDTWRSAAGVISVFSVEKFIREEVATLGREVAFSTEILPDYKDLVGPNALTCSWGQEIHPFRFTDLSHQKWILPAHKQHYIRRMEKDRRPILTHAWLNGQGIQVWENIFGTMNLWNARDRHFLRHMNAIWQNLSPMYLTDEWKPFLPTGNPAIAASQWEQNGQTLWHFTDTTFSEKGQTLRISVGNPDGLRFFDLWNGQELQASTGGGQAFVELTIRNFGALLATSAPAGQISALLARQQADPLPNPAARDAHAEERSIKQPDLYAYKKGGAGNFGPELLPVKGGPVALKGKHIWREGHCYPDPEAKDNHDLKITREDGQQYILHDYSATLPNLSIMPRVVTNGQFEAFLKATGYQPRFPERFLHHWKGSTCPPELAGEPVVYVSLEDARAFAEWAGLQLPTEWEWQHAAAQLGDQFRFNEVFEWNESERNDGFNRFVSLRGGSESWKMPSSWWYLPSAPYAQTAGGPQPAESHHKYFLMYPGMDRAATVGFRCVQK